MADKKKEAKVKQKDMSKQAIKKVRNNDADAQNADCIGNYAGILGPDERKDVPQYVMRYPYKVSPNYLTAAETKLLQELRKYFDNRIVFGVKSRMADLLDIDNKILESRSLTKYTALRAIAEKHVDFTLIDIDKGVAICCVELDDIYHNSYENIQKDVFKDEVFKECGIPLFRIKTKIKDLVPARDFREIENYVLEYFAPKCPVCGKPMLLKHDRYNYRFYACYDNRKCRKTIQID